jgi:outer membrane receptor protein involved in Fe transport
VGTQKNFRVRGQSPPCRWSNFGQAGPLDTYNLERAELSSGPNAILFGTGAAGGLLNMSIKRPNLRRPAVENGWCSARSASAASPRTSMCLS